MSRTSEINIEHETNVPLYIADSKAGSAPHDPETDVKLIMEMNADHRITKRFGDIASSLEETLKDLNPESDVRIIQDLLNSEVAYEDTDVVERRIQMSQNGDGTTNPEMIGWVAFYRSLPQRLPRFFKEGLLSEENYDDNHPVLEISYARAKEAPKGILREGIQAEIFRLYTVAMNTEFNGKTLAEDSWEKTNMYESTADNPKQISYNQICPVRILAIVDIDNLGSANVAESLGFIKKGVTKSETAEEAEDPDNIDSRDEIVYELDWDKFMQIVNSKTSSALESLPTK